MSVTYISPSGTPVKTRGKAARRSIGGRTEYHFRARYRRGKTECTRHIWMPTYEDAVAWEAQQRDISRAASSLTWQDAAKIYLDKKLISTDQARRVRNDADACAREACRTIEGTTHKEFMHWLSDIADRISADAANKRRARLLAVARWCRKYGYIRRVDFEHAPRFEHHKTQRQTIPTEQIGDYLSACSEYVRLPVLLLFVTGLRCGEVCGLRLADIGDDEFSVIKKGGKQLVRIITPPIRDIFAQAHALRAAHDNPSREFLFFNSRGNGWTSDALDKRWRKDIRRAGLPHRRLHEIRHTVSTLAGRKFLPREVQALLGHDQLATSDIYHHADAETAARVQGGVLTTFLPHLHPFFTNPAQFNATETNASGDGITCPECGHKFSPDNKKGHKSR